MAYQFQLNPFSPLTFPVEVDATGMIIGSAGTPAGSKNLTLKNVASNSYDAVGQTEGDLQTYANCTAIIDVFQGIFQFVKGSTYKQNIVRKVVDE